MSQDFAAYFTEIEDEFVRRRGSQILLSPSDWALIEEWKRQGVPLEVVLRGIRETFDGAKGRRINSLSYCKHRVEALFAEHCASQSGEEPDRSSSLGS